MPLFSFRTRNGNISGASDPCELAGRDEAWEELTRVCGDFVVERCRKLEPDSEWSVELLDATDTPLFRIRLLAETMVLTIPADLPLALMNDPRLLI